MKMNLRKSLVVTTILFSSVATLGISFFIVGGYGNNINSLSEIKNSGFFGLSTAFEKGNTTTLNTKEKYVDSLRVILKEEAAKKDTEYYKDLEDEINAEEEKIKEQEAILEPLRIAVEKAQENFNKNRTPENKAALEKAQNELDTSEANGLISESRALIEANNEIIVKINLSEGDISRLDNYSLWNSLFITGATLLAIGSIMAITSTSYSIYLKKQERKIAE